MNNKFAQYIYETPDDWGETTVADEPTMSNDIETMVEQLGDDWKDCELYDCYRFALIKPITENIALYQRKNVRENEYCLYKNIGDGYYKLVCFQGMFGVSVAKFVVETDEDAILEAEEFVSDMMEK